MNGYEIDSLMTPPLQTRVKEVHPEVCFYAMNGDKALEYSKRRKQGLSLRRRLLEDVGFGDLILQALQDINSSQAGMDDILDACVACWTAERIHRNQAARVPEIPPRDSRGLLMEIWR